MGNTTVAIPSRENPLPVCELYRVLDASDLPGGVINIVTGTLDELERTLIEHDTVQALWNFGPNKELTERLSAANLKQTWCPANTNWQTTPSREFLRHAVQVKNVWVPYGA